MTAMRMAMNKTMKKNTNNTINVITGFNSGTILKDGLIAYCGEMNWTVTQDKHNQGLLKITKSTMRCMTLMEQQNL